MSDRIAVFSVDGHPLLSDGLATVFNAQLDLRLVGQSSIGRETIQNPSALSTLEFVDTSTWEEIIRILEESSI
jgi:hypothetical protein